MSAAVEFCRVPATSLGRGQHEAEHFPKESGEGTRVAGILLDGLLGSKSRSCCRLPTLPVKVRVRSKANA
jgi:hypothetical protein